MNREKPIYLDYAAATPLDPQALEAMIPYYRDDFYNPSSPYDPAIQVRHAYESAKETIGRIIGVKSHELVMTAGATESTNIAFGSVSGHVITSVIEHQAVLEAAALHDHNLVGVLPNGRIDINELEKRIRPDTELISIGLANNEIGTIQPLRDIAELIERKRRQRRERGEMTPLYLHSDASQGLGLLDIHVSRLGVDMLTLNAAKVYGPKQVGLLWAARQVRLEPAIVGGGQEQGIRSGTENVPGVIGFSVALQAAESRRKQESERLRGLRDWLRKELMATFPEMIISGDMRHQLPNFLSISFPGLDGERLLFLLEMKGVLVATGSACAANKGTRSHVLTAIGLTAEIADGSLRVSLGRDTDEQSIDYAYSAIVEAVRSEQERCS